MFWNKLRALIDFFKRKYFGFENRHFRLVVMSFFRPKTFLRSVRPDTGQISTGGPYSVVSDSHVQNFEKLLGHNRVLTDPHDVNPYNVDWLSSVQGCSKVVLKPKTSQEVADILKICSKDNLAVCPQGGNTGLVGGSVPVFDEIVISMSLMNQIIHVDELGGTVSCEAGCVLEKVNEALQNHRLMLPYDLGAKGSCQIGGNISTLAGGLRLIRYNGIQANTLGLEAVLADGRIVDCMSNLRKDNTGYHLRQMFIGSEGSLGIVTKAVIQCPTLPQAVNLAFLGLDSFNDVLSTYSLAKSHLSEILSACEMIDADSILFVEEKLGLSNPIKPHNFYMMIETHGSNEEHDNHKMNGFLSTAMDQGFVQDGTTTNEPSRMKKLWEIRERIPESFTKESYLYMYDISLPLSPKYYDIVNILKDKLKNMNVLGVTGFSHLGDSNLHVNIISKEYDEAIVGRIQPFIFEYTAMQGGSISAEHGIGFLKSRYLKFSKPPEAIRVMKSLKKTLDPQGILNPYKVLPSDD